MSQNQEVLAMSPKTRYIKKCRMCIDCLKPVLESSARTYKQDQVVSKHTSSSNMLDSQRNDKRYSVSSPSGKWKLVQSQERKKPNHGVANPKDKLCPPLTKCRRQILCDYDANLPSTSESCNTASNFEHDHCNSLKSKDYSEDTSDTRIEFVDVATNTKQSQFQISILISDHAYSSKEDECIDTNMVDNTLNSTLNEVEIDVDNMTDFSLEDLDSGSIVNEPLRN